VLPSTFFSIGYLATKHGQSLSYYDQSVRLSGPFSVLSRSIVVSSTDIHNLGEPLGCCNIHIDNPLAHPDPLPATNLVPRKQAICQIQDLAAQNLMSGYFLLETPARTPQLGTDIFRSGIAFLTAGDIALNHIWWISESGGMRPFCPANGSIYTPKDYWGPDPSQPGATRYAGSASGTIGAGDMVAKYGLMRGNIVNNAVNADAQLQLSGPFSVMGRGIAVLMQDGAVSCCTILEIPTGLINTSATVTFGAAGRLNLVSLNTFYGSAPTFVGMQPLAPADR